MEIFAAFSLGLFGSLHCVGMCGPLMLAAGGDWRGVASYQLGRLLTYALVGTLLGGLGLGARLLDLQGTLAIASGILLLLVAVGRLSPSAWLERVPAYGRFQLALRSRVSASFGHRSSLARFGLGCCNGFLPCGLVYLAVIAAANTGGAVSGAVFMITFGLGTLPLLLGLLLGGTRLLGSSRGRLLRFTPVLVAVAGALLIWRGWQAGLPVDFQRFQDIAFPPMCH